MFTSPFWRRVSGWLYSFLAAVLFIGGLNAASGFWVLKRLERRAHTPIRGEFFPSFLNLAFTLKNPELDWRGDFQVLSGKVRVEYDLLSLVPGRRLRVRVKGEELGVRFPNQLAGSAEMREVKINQVHAHLAFSKEGPPEIFLLKVDSPELRFHLVKEDQQ